ncbi:MAG: hypothetical protein ACI3V3_03555 [Faecousia sp.]
MYQGKYESSGKRPAPQRTSPKRRLRWRKQFVLLVSVVALILGIVGGTVAYLVTNSGQVKNTFQPSRVACAVDETFANNVKSDVKIQNTGDTTAYIRAAVVVTWQDENGNVSAIPVKASDYNINWTKENWVEDGGYYYYKAPVTPGESTKVLFTDCKPLVPAPVEGYTLCVEILADAVQSSPAQAVIDAWGVDPSTLGNGGAAE